VNGPQAVILLGFALLVGGMILFYLGVIMSYSAQISNHLGAELNTNKWYSRSRIGAVAVLAGMGIIWLGLEMAGNNPFR
jgi:hypothetical protein